jgi:hypothetical protein
MSNLNVIFFFYQSSQQRAAAAAVVVAAAVHMAPLVEDKLNDQVLAD